MDRMKKMISQIVVFLFLLVGYCPFVISNSHMEMPVSHAHHDTSMTHDSQDQVDCCEEGMPEIDRDTVQNIEDFQFPSLISNDVDDQNPTNELNPPDWNFIANNSDPPHLSLIGTVISLE